MTYIVIFFVLGIYKLGFSSIYLSEYLTTPPIIEKRTIGKYVNYLFVFLFHLRTNWNHVIILITFNCVTKNYK